MTEISLVTFFPTQTLSDPEFRSDQLISQLSIVFGVTAVMILFLVAIYCYLDDGNEARMPSIVVRSKTKSSPKTWSASQWQTLKHSSTSSSNQASSSSAKNGKQRVIVTPLSSRKMSSRKQQPMQLGLRTPTFKAQHTVPVPLARSPRTLNAKVKKQVQLQRAMAAAPPRSKTKTKAKAKVRAVPASPSPTTGRKVDLTTLRKYTAL